jgi:hypothetical protein
MFKDARDNDKVKGINAGQRFQTRKTSQIDKTAIPMIIPCIKKERN